MKIKNLSKVAVLIILFSSHARAQELIDFNFDELRVCKGEFGYEKVFLMDGRAEDEVLTKDVDATEFIKTIDFGEVLQPVSFAYSMVMPKNYIQAEFIKGRVNRLAIVLVKKQGDGPAPGDQNGFDFDIALIGVGGELNGLVMAVHPASIDQSKKFLKSPRFTCRATTDGS